MLELLPSGWGRCSPRTGLAAAAGGRPSWRSPQGQLQRWWRAAGRRGGAAPGWRGLKGRTSSSTRCWSWCRQVGSAAASPQPLFSPADLHGHVPVCGKCWKAAALSVQGRQRKVLAAAAAKAVLRLLRHLRQLLLL